MFIFDIPTTALKDMKDDILGRSMMALNITAPLQ